MIIGAPVDGGTSHRPGARFGPQAIRFTDYLPHDGSRPHLALGVDPLKELKIADAGDIELPSGDTELSLRRLEAAVQQAASGGTIPVILGGDHTITFPDATGVARHVGWGRLSMIHSDAHADTGNTQFGSLYGTARRCATDRVRSGTRRQVPQIGCAGTGRNLKRWTGWRASGCAAMR
jgi:agmatinase